MIQNECPSARRFPGLLKDAKETPELWNVKAGGVPLKEERRDFATPPGIVDCLFFKGIEEWPVTEPLCS